MYLLHILSEGQRRVNRWLILRFFLEHRKNPLQLFKNLCLSGCSLSYSPHFPQHHFLLVKSSMEAYYVSDKIMSSNLIQVDPIKRLIKIWFLYFHSGISHTPVATCMTCLDFDVLYKCPLLNTQLIMFQLVVEVPSDSWHASFKNQND